MRQKYMIDGMAPTGAAWGVATTGILGWPARIAAVVIGVTALLVTCLVSIPVLLLAWPVHLIRRRMGRPLRRFGSWITTMLSAALLAGVVLVVLMLQRTPSGTTVWRDAMTTAHTAASQPPPPPPAWLRNLPGADAGYHAPSAGATLAGGVIGLGIFAEFLGALFGSITWGAAWLVVSGWTGRRALVPE